MTQESVSDAPQTPSATPDNPGDQVERTLWFVDDVTAADVAAIEAFLDQRLDALTTSLRFDSEEWRAAYALSKVVRGIIGDANYYLRNAPQNDSGDAVRRRQNIKEAWNQLWEAVISWRRAEGFDHARWCHIEHMDAAAKKRHDVIVAQLNAEKQAEGKPS